MGDFTENVSSESVLFDTKNYLNSPFEIFVTPLFLITWHMRTLFSIALKTAVVVQVCHVLLYMQFINKMPASNLLKGNSNASKFFFMIYDYSYSSLAG